MGGDKPTSVGLVVGLETEDNNQICLEVHWSQDTGHFTLLGVGGGGGAGLGESANISCRGAGIHLIALYHLSHQGSPPSTFILSCEKFQQGVFCKDMFSADKVCGQCSKVS